MGTRLAHTPRSRCHPQMGRRHRLARPPPHKPPPKQLGLTLHQLFLSFNPDLYPQPPTNTRSPTLNSEEPEDLDPYPATTRPTPPTTPTPSNAKSRFSLHDYSELSGVLPGFTVVL